MRSFALITPGPAWTDGRPIFDQDADVLSAHLDTMRELFDRRALLMGGPEKGGRCGFALFDTSTADEATRHMNDDPAVRAGIFRYTMHELVPYFDAFDLTRHSRAGR
jgi:uncharacterized protein YciI